jgi:hypothetical protein
MDYYGALDLKGLLGLKSVLSDINNALTMRLALGFVDWIGTSLSFDEGAIESLRNDIFSTKPNANGFDIHCFKPRPFVAEVKCNVPINGGGIYGARQKHGIISDIESLLNGKSKAKPVHEDSLKFMVFLDLQVVRQANDHLKASNAKISKAFELLKQGEKPDDPKVVYGVYVPLGA